MSQKIPLSVAALRLKVPYRTILDWVTRGRLSGGRDPYGHWFADEDHVARLVQEQASTPEAQPQAGRPPGKTGRDG
jgi:predicted site-specific integrase-resolvase